MMWDNVYMIILKLDNRGNCWGRVTHIYVSKLTIIGSDNGLSPGRQQQANIWANAGILWEPREQTSVQS